MQPLKAALIRFNTQNNKSLQELSRGHKQIQKGKRKKYKIWKRRQSQQRQIKDKIITGNTEGSVNQDVKWGKDFRIKFQLLNHNALEPKTRTMSGSISFSREIQNKTHTNKSSTMQTHTTSTQIQTAHSHPTLPALCSFPKPLNTVTSKWINLSRNRATLTV